MFITVAERDRLIMKSKVRAKNLIASMFEKRGLSISGYGHANSLRYLLQTEAIDTAVDVGANVGQYAKWLRGTVNFSGQILSVEPSSESHGELTKNASGDYLWKIIPRCALGCERGEATLNISANSVSSSILSTTAKLEEIVGAAKAVRAESVSMRTLEDVRNEYLNSTQRAFLKIDAQGFERQIVGGIGGNYDPWPIIQLELSLAPLYEGETALSGMVSYLESLGYKIYGMFPSFWTRSGYRLLQMDCLFVRKLIRADL